MVAGKFRSRSMRRVAKRTPGGKNLVHYVQRKPSRPACGGCGSLLHGIACMTKTQARTANKTRKRPERPHGGVLCSACSRRVIIRNIRKARQAEAADQGDDVQ